MWEPFTERARKAIVLAQEEAQRLGNNYIGTEHLLLGIISEGESVAAKVLENLGISLQKVRSEVEAKVRKWFLHPGRKELLNLLLKKQEIFLITILEPNIFFWVW
jgi:ATP-dependent Clp protease ATP-binding subunit ClpC